MAPKKSQGMVGLTIEDQRVIGAALRTAINAYEANEKTFRAVVEDLQNGKSVPMFAAGDAGIKAARKLADSAFVQAKDAKETLAKLETDEEAEAGAS